MDSVGIQAFGEGIKKEIARRYNLKPDDLSLVGQHQNLVYRCIIRGEICFLRIAHSSHRTEMMTRGEIDWQTYLAGNGFPAVRPVPSSQGNIIEIINAESSYFSVAAFQEAIGQSVANRPLTDSLCKVWGRTIGRAHALTRQYKPLGFANSRPAWHDLDLFAVDKYFPPSQVELLDKCHELFTRLRSLDARPDTYGLIHGDMHPGNFVESKSGEVLICFDFDDCHYNWFMFDIATAVFFAYRMEYVARDFATWFVDNLLAGYSMENSLESSWLSYLPDFVKLREISKCVLYHKMYVMKDQTWDYSRLNMRQRRNMDIYIAHIGHDCSYMPGL